MKRLAVLLLIALPASALTRPAPRVGVLLMSERHAYGAEQTVARTVQRDLRSELRALGFDAFDTQLTYDDLRRNAAGNADYYVEIVSSEAANHPMGDVAVGGGPLTVDVAVVVSRVAAQVRVYDGRTLELTQTYDLQRNRTMVVPAAIGIGGRSVWAWIAIPFIQYGQYRSAAHAVARDAAARIAGR